MNPDAELLETDYLKFLFLHDRDYVNPQKDSERLRMSVHGIKSTIYAMYPNPDDGHKHFLEKYVNTIHRAIAENNRLAMFFLLMDGLCQIQLLADYVRGKCPLDRFDRFLVHLKAQMIKFKTGENIENPTADELKRFKDQSESLKREEKERKRKQAEAIARDRATVFEPEHDDSKPQTELKQRATRKGRGKKATAKAEAAKEAARLAAIEKEKNKNPKSAKDVKRSVMEFKYRDVQDFVERMSIFYLSGAMERPETFPLATTAPLAQ